MKELAQHLVVLIEQEEQTKQALENAENNDTSHEIDFIQGQLDATTNNIKLILNTLNSHY